jgi:hypothetical protein
MKPLKVHKVIVEARIRTTYLFDVYEDVESMKSSVDVALIEQERFSRQCGVDDVFSTEIMSAEVLPPTE